MTSSATPESKPLRLWPAVLLVALMWVLRNVTSMVGELSPPVFMASFLGPAACALLILIWWVAASRASGREKLLGLFGWLGLLVATILLADPSVRGFPIISGAVPWAATAFVVALVVVEKARPSRRTAIALIATAVVFSFWTLMRVEGVWGDFEAERAWRWQQRVEDRFLTELEGRAGDATLVEPLAEVDWPGFRGPGRDSVVPGVVLAEDWSARPPRELWRIRVGPGWSSFAVAGRRLFTQEQRGEAEAVAAYDTETGAELWAFEYPSRFFEALGGVGPRATPTLADGMLFAQGAEGLLHRLDPTTGASIWRVDLREDAGREPPTWGFASSPLVVAGVVIVYAGGEGDRGVLAYDAEEGRLLWGAPTGGHSYSSPQLSRIAGRWSVPLVTDSGLTLLDPADGEVLWQYEWPFDNYRVLQPLVLDDSTLLMSTGLGVGTRRLDLSVSGGVISAEERWTTRALKPEFNDIVEHDGFLYGFDPSILACVDLQTGERRWKGGRYGHGQLLLLPDADQLLVLSEKGALALVRAAPEGLEELTRLEVLEGKTWNHPALVGDRLYVRNGAEAVALEMPLG